MKVGDLFKIIKGKKVKEVYFEKKDGLVRYIQIDDLRSDDQIKYTNNDPNYVFCSEDDLVIAWDGANAGTIGFGLSGVIGSTLAVLKKKDSSIKFDTGYVGRFMKTKSAYLREKCTGATIPHIQKGILENIEIPLPPLHIQKQIAQVLDEADALIQKRKLAIAKLDELVQSVFLEMFGDYRVNNKQFPEGKVSDVVSDLLAGWSTGGEDRAKKPGEFGVLTTSAVTTGTFNPDAYKVVTVDVSQGKKLVHPLKDDVLVSRMNTRELVGASCIVDKDYPDLFLPDRLWKVVLRKDKVNPYYFVKAIQDKGFREAISRVATGTSGSMLNISKEKFMNIKFLIPPMELQESFARQFKQIQSQKSLMQQQLAKLEENFNALLQRAFKGELQFRQAGEWDAPQRGFSEEVSAVEVHS